MANEESVLRDSLNRLRSKLSARGMGQVAGEATGATIKTGARATGGFVSGLRDSFRAGKKTPEQKTAIEEKLRQRRNVVGRTAGKGLRLGVRALTGPAGLAIAGYEAATSGDPEQSRQDLGLDGTRHADGANFLNNIRRLSGNRVFNNDFLKRESAALEGVVPASSLRNRARVISPQAVPEQSSAPQGSITAAPGAGLRIREQLAPGAATANGGGLSVLSGRTGEEQAAIDRNVAAIQRQGELQRDAYAARLGISRDQLDIRQGRKQGVDKRFHFSDGDVLHSRFGKVRPEKAAKIGRREAQAQLARAQAAEAQADAAGGSNAPSLRDRLAALKFEHDVNKDTADTALAAEQAADEKGRNQVKDSLEAIDRASENPDGSTNVGLRQGSERFTRRTLDQTPDANPQRIADGKRVDSELRNRFEASSGVTGSALDFGNNALTEFFNLFGGDELTGANDLSQVQGRVNELLSKGTINGVKIDLGQIPPEMKELILSLAPQQG